MAGIPGRLNPLYGWNAYEWCQDMRYTTSVFTALSFSGQTPTTAQATVTVTGVPATGSKVGLLYGTGMSWGYAQPTHGDSSIVAYRLGATPATISLPHGL